MDRSPQAPLSVGFPRQEYWSGLPCTPPGDLPIPGIEPASLASPALAGGFFITDTTWEALSPMAYFNILINRTLALPTQITLQHATHRMTIPLRNPYNSSTECTQVLHILLNLKLET